MTSVSSKQKFFSHNNIDKLRMKLYDIACHLQLSSDGVTCEPGFTVDQSWPVYMYMYNVQNVHVRIYSEYKLKITLLTSCYFPSPAPSPSLFPPSSLPPPPPPHSPSLHSLPSLLPPCLPLPSPPPLPPPLTILSGVQGRVQRR